MNKLFLLIVICCAQIFFFSPCIKAAEVIKNSAIPLNNNAGRLINLEEIIRIKDNGSDYYFKFPVNVKTSKDGSIFVEDERQLLKFDASGEYIRNFFKYGQGPFEILSVSNYQLVENRLIIHDSAQNKVIVYDHNTGEALKEFRFPSNIASYLKFLLYYKEGYYFYKASTPDTKGKPEIFDLDVNVLRVWAEGKSIEKVDSFPVRYFVLQSGDRFFTDSRARFITCPAGDGKLYLSHTPEYEIKLYDFTRNKVTKRFTREYKRIRVTDDDKRYAPGGNFGRISIGSNKWYKMPVAEFHLDIQKILIIGNRLLVVTSTTSGEKKVLVDVYNSEGQYLDNFYLECPSGVSPLNVRFWLAGSSKDSLFLIEDDKNGQKFIKKVRLK